MYNTLRRVMLDVTRLTHTGRLADATAQIQAALRGAATEKRDAAVTVDDSDVIDVVAREVDTGVGAQRPAAEPSTERFVAGRFGNTAGARDYKLYVPPGADAHPLPLIVMLHGCTQNPDDFAAGTRMNERAAQSGCFVLYPAQAQNANASKCWNWFKHNHQRRGAGEPALLVGMTQDVMRQHAIDPKRIYVAGLSAGGAMAAILGDAYPDVFAAVGVHSGLPPGSARNVKSAFDAMKSGAAVTTAARMKVGPPVIVFHGDQDTTVHPINGIHVAGADASASADSERLNAQNGRSATRTIYRDVDGCIVSEHWLVHGAGHAWSGGSAQGSYADVKGPDATEEMMRFFLARELRDQRPIG